MTKPVKKSMLVKAPDGFGFYLTHQTPKIYVSGRPHVVTNDSQVQMASARKALILLGETTMTDEEFLVTYKKDPASAVESAIENNDKADKPEVKKAAKSAAASKKAAADTKKAEAERIAKEAETKKAAEEAHAAELSAKGQEGKD